MRTSIAFVAFGICLGLTPTSNARTLVGTWQAAYGNTRGVIKISKEADGKLHAEIYHLGPEASGFTRNGNPASSIKVDGRHVHFDLDDSDRTFDGMLSVDGDSLTGTWTVNGSPLQLKFDRATAKTAWVIDPSPHKVLFVPVEKNVRLEVLDWGGNGPPLVLLAGNGNTAHVFDKFALDFTGRHHVYGITRRGFGLSSKPTPSDANYDADRLGNDVLAVIDALKLDHPVIAGHSLAGEELSSIGTRHPERVAGLIYLDASYSYAYYNSAGTSDALQPDIATMRRDALALFGNVAPSRLRSIIQEMQTTMPRLQHELQRTSEIVGNLKDPPSPPRRTLRDRVEQHISVGAHIYTHIKGPVLAIVAVPVCGTDCSNPGLKARLADITAQTDAFEAGTPQAHVVRLPNARHYVFRSNEADVVREMNAFMDGLH